jgi:hypothetical protein
MKASRRDFPIPHDFGLALAQRRISLNSLTTQLRPNLSRQMVLSQLPSPPPEDVPEYNLTLTITESNGSSEITKKPHILSHLPPLPGKHAYKATAVYTKRELDPQKIRAKAAEQGRLGEGALRRLISAASASDGRHTGSNGTGVHKSKRTREREEMYEQVMEKAKKGETKDEIGAEEDLEIDYGDEGEPRRLFRRYAADVPGFSAAAIEAVVNSESRFFRRPAKSSNIGGDNSVVIKPVQDSILGVTR